MDKSLTRHLLPSLSDVKLLLCNNGVPSNQTVVADETINVDQWMVAVTPNDGLLDGMTEYSEEFSFDCAGNDARAMAMIQVWTAMMRIHHNQLECRHR